MGLEVGWGGAVGLGGVGWGRGCGTWWGRMGGGAVELGVVWGEGLWDLVG